MTTMDSEQILDLPMEDNDAKASTVKDYLIALLIRLIEENEGFDGKRPFGNSGWDWDLYAPLLTAGLVDGKFDTDGFIEDIDEKAAKKLILRAIGEM